MSARDRGRSQALLASLPAATVVSHRACTTKRRGVSTKATGRGRDALTTPQSGLLPNSSVGTGAVRWGMGAVSATAQARRRLTARAVILSAVLRCGLYAPRDGEVSLALPECGTQETACL